MRLYSVCISVRCYQVVVIEHTFWLVITVVNTKGPFTTEQRTAALGFTQTTP